MPLLRIAGRRYALASDRLGTRCSATEISGTGRIRLQLEDEELVPRVSAVSAVLAGRDGSVVHIDHFDQPHEVPIGDYRLLSLVLALTQTDEPVRWTFAFSNAITEGHKWYGVPRDGTTSIDPVGTLQWAAELDKDPAEFAPGETFFVKPQLYTSDRLRLQTSYWGTDPSGSGGQPQAVVAVTDQIGQLLDQLPVRPPGNAR